MSASRVNQQKPHLSKAQKAAIATNASAWAIIHNEAVARESKTDRLRKERLAKEASEPLLEKPKRGQHRRTKV